MPNNCITIEAEMYGMIPNANIEAFEKAPPENISNKPRSPELALFRRTVNKAGSIPGRTTNEPNLYTATKEAVMISR